MSVQFLCNDFIPDNNIDYAIVSQYGFDLFKSILIINLSKEDYFSNKSMIVKSHSIMITDFNSFELDPNDSYCIVDIDKFKNMVNFFKSFDSLKKPLNDERLKDFNLLPILDLSF